MSALDWWGDLGHKLVFWAVVACGIAAWTFA